MNNKRRAEPIIKLGVWMMKNSYLIATTTFLFAGCASVPPYMAPPPNEASATLTIAIGNEDGESKLSLGRKDADDCLEFPVLYSFGSVRVRSEESPVPKEIKIPVGKPQIFQYRRNKGRNSSAQFCEINMQFVPEKDTRYLIVSGNRYLESENKIREFFAGPKEECLVRVFQKDDKDALKPVAIEQLKIKPTRLGVPGCPKVVK
jgi:hypothetical protein